MTKNRTIKKQIWMNADEASDLRAKASAACMSEARFVRMLITGYAPRPAPDDRFFQVMELIKEFGDRLERIETAIKDPTAVRMLEVEAEKWHMFQNVIEQKYLLPEKVM